MTGLRQELRFAHAPTGARLAWASTGRGPVLIRAAHWMTHVEHDLRSAVWRPWLERLSAGLRVVRYDGRGFGLSEADDQPLGVDGAREDLEAVADACRAGRFALLGMSAGASAAIAYAVRHPERVSRPVLCGGYARGTLLRDTGPEAAAFFEAAVRLIETGWGQRNPAVRQMFTTRMLPEATPEQARALNEQQRLSCSSRHAAEMMRAAGRIDVRALLAQVRCPTLVLHAEGDPTVPVEEGRLLAAGIPDARFESLPTSNHIPMSHEPAFERFCVAVTEFVAGAPVAEADPVLATLNARERALLALLARGLDNHQIAAQLERSEKTVRNALSALYAKLAVEGRAQAIVRARDSGIGGLGA
jgi:pimeloyl-ACP methyl ester carboxylesterase/DNA-binding CsgD family transcriptional regulator